MKYFEITKINKYNFRIVISDFLVLFVVVRSKPQLHIMKYIWFGLPLNLEYITKETVNWTISMFLMVLFLVFFFKNLAQTHVLNELMYEIKEKGTKLKICHTSDSQLVSIHWKIQIWENMGRSWRTGNQSPLKAHCYSPISFAFWLFNFMLPVNWYYSALEEEEELLAFTFCDIEVSNNALP